MPEPVDDLCAQVGCLEDRGICWDDRYTTPETPVVPPAHSDAGWGFGAPVQPAPGGVAGVPAAHRARAAAADAPLGS